MKNLLTIVTCALFALPTLQAQTSFGLKAGVSPSHLTDHSYIFVNRADPLNEFTFNTRGVDNGVHLGLYMRQELNHRFFIGVEALYAQFSTQYDVTYIRREFPRSGASAILNETTHRVSLPVSIGVRLGIFEVTSGVVGHINLARKGELGDLPGYRDDSRGVVLGMHSALGLNISHVRLELGYQLDFENYGANRFVNGQSLQLLNAPGRLMTSIAYRF